MKHTFLLEHRSGMLKQRYGEVKGTANDRLTVRVVGRQKYSKMVKKGSKMEPTQ